MTSLTSRKGAEIEKLVFIDSTWSQAKHIFKDPRLQGTRGIPAYLPKKKLFLISL